MHGFGLTVESQGPLSIRFDRDDRIQDKGVLSADIVVEDAGRFNELHVIDLLTKFSQSVSYFIDLLEDI